MNQALTEIEQKVQAKPVAKRRWLWGFWKWLVGAVTCQNPLFALVGAGWGYRLAERSALKVWWKEQAPPKTTFRQAARENDFLKSFEHTPNWIWAQDRTTSGKLRRWLGGLLENLSLGLKAWFHSSIFLLVPSLLMMMSWYSGWDNSFNKGYEQFAVGAQLGWLGLVLLAIVMLYLPVAQARFAVTRETRSFYHFRSNRRIIRAQWRRGLLLVMAYALLGAPLMAGDSLLGLLMAEQDKRDPNALSELTAEQALGFLQTYFFWWGFYVFAAFVFLRCWAARIYARGLRTALRRGRLSVDDLLEREREALGALQVQVEPTAKLSTIRSLTSNLARIAIGGTVAILIWLAFGIQTHVSQFFVAQPEIKRFVNRPLVQIPWFHHIPAHLKKGLLEPEMD